MPRRPTETAHPLHAMHTGWQKGEKTCDYPGCDCVGTYPAPKSRVQLGRKHDYYFFCLEHVRLYNAAWDYFEGASQDEIYEQIQRDARWDRPTWSPDMPLKWEERIKAFAASFFGHQHQQKQQQQSKPLNNPDDQLAQALRLFNLKADCTLAQIKQRYRQLAKRFHPDSTSEEADATRFHALGHAYQILQTHYR